VTNQAHLLRLAGALEVQNILCTDCIQGDDLLVEPAAQKVTHAREAGVSRLINPHAKRDCTLVQDRNQPAAGIAPVKQQQVATAKAK